MVLTGWIHDSKDLPRLICLRTIDCCSGFANQKPPNTHIHSIVFTHAKTQYCGRVKIYNALKVVLLRVKLEHLGAGPIVPSIDTEY